MWNLKTKPYKTVLTTQRMDWSVPERVVGVGKIGGGGLRYKFPVIRSLSPGDIITAC